MSQQPTISLRWLKERPHVPAGVTWGVPWARGELRRGESLALVAPSGEPVPVQSWPTAYWPDGSVKWTAHAASLLQAEEGEYTLMRGEGAAPAERIRVTEAEEYIEVDTGAIRCRINRQGDSVIREIVRGEARVCSGGQLVGIRESRAYTLGSRTVKEEPFAGYIRRAAVEQSGPVRAVVKLEGRHRAAAADAREWLPFTLRLYFYAGQHGIKAVHTFLYDGNPHKDFIKGLGIAFRVPLEGPLYNRNVRLAGDTGLFSESPKNLLNWRLDPQYTEAYRRQIAGLPIKLNPTEDERLLELLDDAAVWDAYKLTQVSADSYTIYKRTDKAECSWIRAVGGRRSAGLAYAGSEAGGLAVGLRRFWQKCPSALEVRGLSGSEAVVTAWFWSPDAPAMDLRHYDTETHVASAYEGADELRSTPYGIGNTSELGIWCFDAAPASETLRKLAGEKEEPPLFVCAPEHYHGVKAFGAWSLPDRSTPLKAQLEDTLDEVVRFYQEEVEQRGWYGFWDYGDFMHSYDPVRHTWKYDIGGCAWQNTELAPNFWLWYMFLRSGREDLFRLAEAMTRHTSEVDVYHIGEYAGLGSRHNVLHWGCGCKEARIGMAGLHRFYYYLTADERIGDIMDEVRDADYALERLDPMRYYYPKDEFPTHARSGPDWAAFCSNWMTRWERYEDQACLDKMRVGIDSLKKMPYRLLTGPVFGYDPKTGELSFMGNENWGHHLIICMGGAQVWMELASLLDDPEWESMLDEFGEFYNLPSEEKARRTSGEIQGKQWNIPMLSTSLAAYSAARRNDRELAELAWKLLLEEQTHWQVSLKLETEDVDGTEYVRPLREIPWMSTNTASQWSINVIICLELIGQELPQQARASQAGAL